MMMGMMMMSSFLLFCAEERGCGVDQESGGTEC